MLEADKHVMCAMTPVYSVVNWNDQIYDAHYSQSLYSLKEILNEYTMNGTAMYDNLICHQYTKELD